MYINTIDVVVTGVAGILLARSLFKMVRDRKPQGAPASTLAQRDARRTKRRRPAVSRPLRRRPIRRVAPGSVLDIIRRNSGSALFVRPLCWTDQHAEVLKVQFNELPICDTPMPVNEPGSPPSKGHMQPSQTILQLSKTLSDILSYKIAHPTVVSDAVRTVMEKLWPDSFCQYLIVPELHLFFGNKVYHEAVRAQIIWAYPSGSCPPSQTRPISSQSTQDATASSSELQYPDPTVLPRHRLTDQPMVCYMGKAQLASIRRNLFRVAPGPNRQDNEPVSNLLKLRSKKLEPKNPNEDSYIAGIMLAMAQKHFYPNPRILSLFRRGTSHSKNARPFRDLKLRFMTHDTERAEFIVYTGHMTATFLERFRRPHRIPPAPKFDGDVGFKIDYARVPIWPILGLRERLGKALGEDVVGEFNAEAMETWEHDVAEAPDPSSSKRKRTALGEVVNGSFEDTEEEQSPRIHSKRRCLQPRTPLKAAA